MLLPGNFEQYRRLADSTSLALTISERMAGRMEFLQMLESRAAKYVMFDVTWCGGLSEARKIASMAEAFELPVAPHTAGGPLLFYASTHLSTVVTNLAIQEKLPGILRVHLADNVGQSHHAQGRSRTRS